MSEQMEQDMQDLAIYDDLITSLITLKVIPEDVDKIIKVIDLKINNKIKQLEAAKVNKLDLLHEELRIIALRNRFLGRLNSVEDKIDLRRQTKKKIDNIEELKEEVKEWGFKSVKIVQVLNYAKNDEIVEIARIKLKLQRLGASKKSINFFKKSNFQRDI